MESTQHDKTKGAIQAEHKKHAPKSQKTGTDHPPDKLGHKILHLDNIICHSRHEGACAKSVELGKRKSHDIPETILADLVPDILS